MNIPQGKHIIFDYEPQLNYCNNYRRDLKFTFIGEEQEMYTKIYQFH